MSEEVEEWRPVVGYEGLYEISSLGRVKSLQRSVSRVRQGTPYSTIRRERIMRLRLYKDRHPRVDLRLPGQRNGASHRVSTLVVRAFMGVSVADRAYTYVDGDPTNTTLKNLSPCVLACDDEIWVPVPSWEQFYEVSSLGRVRSLPRTAERGCGGPQFLPARILATFPVSDLRYEAIVLQDAGRKYRVTVHRLVCEAFHGARPDGHEVCHRDGDAANNRADNLYWGTKSDNERDKIITGFAKLAGISRDETMALIGRLNPEHCTP